MSETHSTSETPETSALDKRLIFILSYLLVFGVASFLAGVILNSAAAFILSGGLFAFFVAVFIDGFDLFGRKPRERG